MLRIFTLLSGKGRLEGSIKTPKPFHLFLSMSQLLTLHYLPPQPLSYKREVDKRSFNSQLPHCSAPPVVVTPKQKPKPRVMERVAEEPIEDQLDQSP